MRGKEKSTDLLRGKEKKGEEAGGLGGKGGKDEGGYLLKAKKRDKGKNFFCSSGKKMAGILN